MKILLTTDWYTPAVNGVVASVRNLQKGLESRGHEVRVLTLSQAARSYTQGSVTYLGSLRAGMIYPGARIRVAPGREELRAIEAWAPDIIHSNCEFSTFFLARHLASKLHAPLLHTYHTVYENYTHYFSPSQTWGRQAVKSFSRWVAGQTDRLIAPTQKVAQLLRSYGIQSPISVIPSGIDQDALASSGSAADLRALRKHLGLRAGRLTLIFVGRLAKEKNCEELLRGMAALRGSPVDLLLVGDGPVRNDLEQAAAEAGVRDQVLFAGMADPKEIGAYYRLGDLFVSASTSETQGLTYAEALLCGLPLLCRRDTCLDGVVIQGVNGWQYTEEADFAVCAKKFLRHPEWREQMGRSAWIAGQRFSLETFAQEVESAYLECLRARRWKEQGSA